MGADEATIVGEGLNTVDSVMFGKTALTITDKSAKQIKVKVSLLLALLPSPDADLPCLKSGT